MAFVKKCCEARLNEVRKESKQETAKKIKEIIKEISIMPNRDDRICCQGGLKVGLLDGGGVGRFDVTDLLEKSFKELKKE